LQLARIPEEADSAITEETLPLSLTTYSNATPLQVDPDAWQLLISNSLKALESCRGRQPKLMTGNSHDPDCYSFPPRSNGSRLNCDNPLYQSNLGKKIHCRLFGINRKRKTRGKSLFH
jgi:hypothetical protein